MPQTATWTSFNTPMVPISYFSVFIFNPGNAGKNEFFIKIKTRIFDF